MQATKKSSPALFTDYKQLKDEIIEISEQRFENILTRRFTEFKKSLMEEINARFLSMESRFDSKLDAMESRFIGKFNAIDSKFDVIDSKFDAIDSKFDAIDSKFDAMNSKFNAMDTHFNSIEKRLSFLTWFLPVFLSLLMIVLKFYGK